jgi:hypothetical protein
MPTAWQIYSALMFALLGTGKAATAASEVRYQSNTGRRTVVVVAHEDDWQLFMGDRIAPTLAAGDTVIIVYLTAGDDGRDSVYWRTRERAALASTRIAMIGRASDTTTRCENSVVKSHSVTRCALGSSISYFLRLPDGRRDGQGFERDGKQSLRKLRARTISSMTTVDNSATYNGWSDLVATVTELVKAGGGGPVVVHTTDPSRRVNPHDHFDHRIAGLLVAEARTGRRWMTWYYVGYALGTRAANRSADQAREKTELFRSYDAEMIRINPKWSAFAEHPGFYSECLLRTYARAVGADRSR